MTELVNPPSKTDLVYGILRRRILDGGLQPGERLSMDGLAREFGISKIPIREAVGRLEAHGLIEARQHAGPSVARVDVDQLRGAYLARAELEPLMAELAAQRAGAEALAEMAELQEGMQTALQGDRIEALGDLNYRFHVLLAEMSGFTILTELAEMLLLAVRRYRVVAPLSRENWEHVVREHALILDAVRRGDPAAAAEAARSHAESQFHSDVTD